MKYKADDLYNYITTTHEIECINCDTTDAIGDCDEIDALEYFFNEGWRVTKGEMVYCPKCAKKKLKQ